MPLGQGDIPLNIEFRFRQVRDRRGNPVTVNVSAADHKWYSVLIQPADQGISLVSPVCNNDHAVIPCKLGCQFLQSFSFSRSTSWLNIECDDHSGIEINAGIEMELGVRFTAFFVRRIQVVRV